MTLTTGAAMLKYLQENRGIYADQLQRLWNAFPREQVLVLQYERCVADPASELRRTYAFIGLEPEVPAGLAAVALAQGSARAEVEHVVHDGEAHGMRGVGHDLGAGLGAAQAEKEHHADEHPDDGEDQCADLDRRHLPARGAGGEDLDEREALVVDLVLQRLAHRLGLLVDDLVVGLDEEPAAAERILQGLGPGVVGGGEQLEALAAHFENARSIEDIVDDTAAETLFGEEFSQMAEAVASMHKASDAFFGKPSMYMGTGGTIPFMGMLGEKFPKAQFLITGLLGPKSNAHGPNEFLHIDTGKRVTSCVAQVLADHYVHKTGVKAAA